LVLGSYFQGYKDLKLISAGRFNFLTLFLL